MGEPKMLELCGEWILGVLSSSIFWNRLRRRIDMMSFAVIQEGRTDGEMRPHELDPITADMMFSAMVEPHIKRIAKFAPIWLADELFRIIVLDQKEGLVESEDSKYTFFMAPYFSSDVYGELGDVGNRRLNDLVEDVFRQPLRSWINEIEQMMEQYNLRNSEVTE
jgi:hypothetical protein